MQDLMVDIETLGTGPKAHILSVGLASFNMEDPDEPVAALSHYLLDAHQPGRTISYDTVKWWMEQSELARSAVFSPRDNSISLAHMLTGVATYIEGAQRIWANGPDFDFVILADAAKDVAPEYKWPFWKHRCVRTMKNAFPNLAAVPFGGTAHNALDDAVYQAQQMVNIARHLPRNIIPL